MSAPILLTRVLPGGTSRVSVNPDCVVCSFPVKDPKVMDKGTIVELADARTAVVCLAGDPFFVAELAEDVHRMRGGLQ